MSDNNFAIDKDGNRIPYSSDEVGMISKDIITRGKIIMVVSVVDDQIGAHVFGPPSEELIEILEQVTTAYRKGLRGR